jgi:hypothetical protein
MTVQVVRTSQLSTDPAPDQAYSLEFSRCDKHLHPRNSTLCIETLSRDPPPPGGYFFGKLLRFNGLRFFGFAKYRFQMSYR